MMSEEDSARDAAARLLEAEATLQRVLKACQDLESASVQLEKAKSSVEELANSTEELVREVRTTATEALKVLKVMQALQPEQFYARLDRIEDAVHSIGQRLERRSLVLSGAGTLVIVVLLLMLRG